MRGIKSINVGFKEADHTDLKQLKEEIRKELGKSERDFGWGEMILHLAEQYRGNREN